jgi:hypothetical protein
MIRSSLIAALLLAGSVHATDYHCGAAVVQSYGVSKVQAAYAPTYVEQVKGYAVAYPNIAFVLGVPVPAFSFQYTPAPTAAATAPVQQQEQSDRLGDALLKMADVLERQSQRLDQIENRLGLQSPRMPLAAHSPINPLTKKNCVACHGPGSDQPLFTRDGQPTGNLSAMRSRVQAGTMPPVDSGLSMSEAARTRLLAEWE